MTVLCAKFGDEPLHYPGIRTTKNGRRFYLNFPKIRDV